MSSSPPVLLVGFMGCGKSEVGRRVADLLGVRFVDLDREIERRHGASVQEQFANDGEAAFRAREAAVLEQVLARAAAAPLVIATGGGVYADVAHRARIGQANGVAVWLEVPLAELEHRVTQDGSRPRWGAPDEVARLFEERASAYAQADVRVDAANGDADQVAERVVAALQSRGGFAWRSSKP